MLQFCCFQKSSRTYLDCAQLGGGDHNANDSLCKSSACWVIGRWDEYLLEGLGELPCNESVVEGAARNALQAGPRGQAGQWEPRYRYVLDLVQRPVGNN